MDIVFAYETSLAYVNCLRACQHVHEAVSTFSIFIDWKGYSNTCNRDSLSYVALFD